RVHVVEAGDRRELTLERRRDRGGHRLGARSRKRRGHLDGRKVYVRQVRNREEPVAHDAEEEDPHHHERRGDRTPDEDLGNIHLIATFAPGARRSCPSVTTRSPGARPLSITDHCCQVRRTTTVRFSTVSSALMTYTYEPCCPAWTAGVGATTEFASVASVSETFVNCPGQSARSRFG